MLGRTVLHYRVEERLGAGGMGEVYRARDLRLERDVALKFLPVARAADRESRSRLLAEARAAAALRSPHIATVYDIAEYEDALFIVMEYVPGEPLSRRTARGALPPQEAVAITLQVASALEEAHARGLVHRDVKSANIMIDRLGVAKVLDFGLARFRPDAPFSATDSTLALTAAGAVVGTLPYMSPEQARGDVLDGRSDLFSLGAVLYEMLTGRMTFTGGSAAEVLDAILHREPAPLPLDSPDLQRIVSRALAKAPADRYQTAADFRADLEVARQALTLTAAPTASAPTTSRRNSVVALHRVAVVGFANITGHPADDWIAAGLAETVASDLKQVRALTVIASEQVADTFQRLSADTASHTSEHERPIQLGRYLGATCIVTGGYQRQGDALRVSARFVDVATGTITKTVRVDGDMTEIFSLQDRIVHELTRDLHIQLHGSEIRAIEEPETRSIQAYEYFSRGLLELRRAETSSLRRAIELFECALEHDAQYASAWAALGAAYDLQGFFSSRPELSQKAVELERRALAINPRLSAAHHWLAVAYLNTGQFESAIEAAGEAIRLDPGNALARAARGRGLAFGRGSIEEAVHELKEAVRVDETLGYAHLLLARLHLLQEDHQAAEDSARHAIQVQEAGATRRGPSVAGGHLLLGLVFEWQGHYGAALQEYEHERAWIESSNHAERNRVLFELAVKRSAALWKLGRRNEADRHYRQVCEALQREGGGSTPGPLERYSLAGLMQVRGDTERALAFLDEAAARLPAFIHLLAAVDPDWRKLRGDPRFDARLRSDRRLPSPQQVE